MALVFAMAGVTKLNRIESFGFLLGGVLGPPIAALVSHFVCWFELTVAACLVTGIAVREAATLAGLAVVAFTIFGQIYHSGNGGCGCLVVEPLPAYLNDGAWAIGRNLALISFSVLVAASPVRPTRS